jgi:hypothetical protein
MKTLLVPMAGRSSRFPGTRPKWMLTHPKNNRLMVSEAISGLNLDFFDKIKFICLEEHQEKYQFFHGFMDELEELGLGDKSSVIFLEKSTSSQSETVYQAIKQDEIEGFIFIKDSDGYYECELTSTNNQVAFFDLNDMDNINARSKSYITIDDFGSVTNIVEKKVISSTFSSGGYGFNSAKQFCDTFETIRDMPGECYISHVIFEMMLDGQPFSSLKTSNFKDWGTKDVWMEYKKTYKTLFSDIDGTLITNSSLHFPPYIGDGEPIQENIDYLNHLYDEGRTYIVLTTSRPEKTRQITVNELELKGVKYHQLVMGLPHSQRIVINDFAASNPYPACGSINLPRNNNNLREFL